MEGNHGGNRGLRVKAEINLEHETRAALFADMIGP
jgi:hypothetical protein